MRLTMRQAAAVYAALEHAAMNFEVINDNHHIHDGNGTVKVLNYQGDAFTEAEFTDLMFAVTEEPCGLKS
jgi:N-acetylglucosamine-6-phosphate deacetylase